MPTAIDHLIVAVPDPEAAATELEGRVGVAPGGGGEHQGMGTFNRVAFFADGAYLELIGVADRAAASVVPVGRAAIAALHRGGGLASYALLDDELPRTVAELQANESPIGPLTPGSRRRPDGDLVEWWTAMPPELAPDRPPFLVRHRYGGVEWGPEAIAARRTFRHPIGSPVSLVRVDIATADPPGLAAEYQRTLGLEFWSVADLAVCTIGPHTIRLVPTREMALPATIVLGAEVDAPRSVDAFGLRIDVEPVERVEPAAATS